MAITRYLAMTAEEILDASPVPERIAWMACHFAPYSKTITNLPAKLPPGSLLILDDSTPPSNLDPKMVVQMIGDIMQRDRCRGLLLDFQRPNHPEIEAIVNALLDLDFPVCVSDKYAGALSCPVFLPPVPLTTPLSEYISPWKDRKIWLDVSLSCEEITVTENGSSFLSVNTAQLCPFEDTHLRCHYHIESIEGGFRFTLRRTKQDLDHLLQDAEALGIEVSVGLYQELK